MRKVEPTRTEIAGLVDEARAQRKNRAVHVRDRLEKLHPELVGQTIRRNGNSYNAIDYIVGDLGSYGPSS